ncbi:uncharacterized protein GIQ15_03523 [Arthroderma uncinatum]|uniref:uncharacterized protein n=1 Tax=Arthroderma uncinatum TaxID=74035 RepID=UPI00144AF24F|nr:uncharacterized protein GIQ15_03523 [Arthroderma uncinatum]KAF3484199.1 hypothetical protein GIQ15_03523 [Arthroderma uncinatum]
MDQQALKERYFCLRARQQEYFFAVAGISEVSSWGGTIDEMIFEESVAWIVLLFAKPGHPRFSPVSEPFEQSKKTVVRSSRPSSRLLTLPAELHHAIFDLLKIRDVVSLGLTCQYLWAISRSVITKYFTRFLGVWAGAPTTCNGHDTRWPYSSFGREELGLFNFVNMRKHRIILAKRPNSITSPKPEFSWSFRDLLRKHALYITQKDRCPADLVRVVDPAPASFYPTNGQWVLRNLTTRQYVTAQAIALKPEYIRGPFIDVLGFGEVIVAHTFNATHGSKPRYCPDIQEGTRCEGVWVGHALDIVPLNAATIDDGWEDASREVMGLIGRICRAEFGEDWQEKLIARKCSSLKPKS